MKISLICIGKTDDAKIKELIDYYLLRLPNYFNFNFIEIPDVKKSKNLTDLQLKDEEAKLFMRYIENADKIVLLDEKGKQYTSREFSSKIDHWMSSSIKHAAILIGGAYGFSEEIYKKADEKIALSKMTFTHQMVRLFFVEQVYRASTILQGKPYHND